MEATFGTYYPDCEIGGRTLPDNTDYLQQHGIFRQHSDEARLLGEQFRRRIAAGDTIYLLGFLGTTHNSGLALVEASKDRGIRVLGNYEEERFSGVKHFAGYPKHSAAQIKILLNKLGKSATDIFCVCYAFDVVHEEQSGMRMLMANGKVIKNKYYKFISESAAPTVDFDWGDLDRMRKNIFFHSPALATVYKKLREDLGLDAGVPCVQMLHHENHAYFSYGSSPFYRPSSDAKTTMIACVDGAGDLSSVSLFKAKGNQIELLRRNHRANSLGVFYMLCASMLGGWSALSSEGRYMGAAAWGNGDRLTNPYYKRLRQFFYFQDRGEVYVNSRMTDHAYAELQDVVGPFLDIADIWRPDAVLNVNDIAHSKITQERVDIAAAVQMVFEDALFHIIAQLIEETQSDQLVLCGGAALNCVANMRLLEHFDDRYYRRYLEQDSRLHMWVPPIPSDQGVVVGAPFQFAMLNGAHATGTLPSPFLCGVPPSTDEIKTALEQVDHVDVQSMGNLSHGETLRDLADWMAYIVSQNGVIGIYQAEAETGPRALGHRSILSNPCNPKTLEVLNSRVKLREKIRPLAPMVTLEEASRWFELAPGASANEYDAYNYMVLTAKVRNCALDAIPAVIHYDGTSRIQIVRKENDRLMYEYLKALKKYIGVEVSVNTSLNVGTPIVQTPAQALEIFKRSKGMDCIFMVGDDGNAFMVWAKPGVQEVDSGIPRLAEDYKRQRAAKPKAALKKDVLEAFSKKDISLADAKKRLEELEFSEHLERARL